MAFNFPTGLILPFDAACPSTWTNISSTYAGKYIKSITVVGSAGGTGGNTQHRHSVNPAAQSSALATWVDYLGCSLGTTIETYGHAHPVNPAAVNTDYNDNAPPYLEMLLCKKD